MVDMKVRCPHCGEIVTFTGKPGERRVVSCPSCGSDASLSFSGGDQKTFDNAIEVSHLRKVYDDLVAVDDISFSVKKGEVFAFLGPNGAGKTTTVEIIESIRTPTNGSVKILDKDVKTQFNQVKEYIGILPQEFHSFERLTVRETLVYFSKLYKKHADIDEIITSMDLSEYAKKLYRNLSGGLSAAFS